MELIDKDQEGPTACPVMASSPSFICVTAKSPTTSAQFVLPEISTVQQFKEDLSKHFSCETSQLVLVFFGRILKDHDTLRQCGIGDGATVHVVIRALKGEQEDRTQTLYGPRVFKYALIPPGHNLTTPSFNLSAQGSWAPAEPSPSGPEWQLTPTSEMILQKVRQVILANPEVQQLAQQIPAISHILNNMDIMRVILDKVREIIELAKNPDMMQDLKNPDQALISMQSSIPGGDNPLRQLNGDAPEPGLNVVQDLFVANPYASMARSPSPEPLGLGCQGSPVDSQEHSGILPPSLSSTSVCSNVPCSDDGGASIFYGLVNPLGHNSRLPSQAAPPSGTGVFGAGGLASPEASEIPRLIINLCNAYTKRLMFSLMQNALLASEGSQPAQQEQVQQQVLHFTQQMQSPEMVAAMSNPKAIQAWVQMEQGLQTLVAEAPVLIPWFMLRLKGLGYSGGDALGQEPTVLE